MQEKLLRLENRNKLICQIVHGELRQVQGSTLMRSQRSMMQDIEVLLLQQKLIQHMELENRLTKVQEDSDIQVQ